MKSEELRCPQADEFIFVGAIFDRPRANAVRPYEGDGGRYGGTGDCDRTTVTLALEQGK